MNPSSCAISGAARRRTSGLLPLLLSLSTFIAAPLWAVSFRSVPGGPTARAITQTYTIATAARGGGGVILVGEAHPDSNISTQKLRFALKTTDAGKRLVAHFNDQEAVLDAPGWLVKSAVAFSASSYNRAVTLLGEPPYEDKDDDSLPFARQLSYWPRVHPDLINTRTGELLLLVDVLLTAPDYYTYYSIDLPGIKKAPILDRAEYDARVSRFKAAMEKFPEAFSNYTWTDPETRYSFSIDQNGILLLQGTPLYYFLVVDDDARSEPGDPLIAGRVNKEVSEFFKTNPGLAEDLHEDAFAAARQFAQLCAFFRYVKQRNDSAWPSLLKACEPLETLSGATPGVLPKSPGISPQTLASFLSGTVLRLMMIQGRQTAILRNVAEQENKSPEIILAEVRKLLAQDSELK